MNFHLSRDWNLLGYRNMIPPVLVNFLLLEVRENRKERCCCTVWAGVGKIQRVTLSRVAAVSEKGQCTSGGGTQSSYAMGWC